MQVELSRNRAGRGGRLHRVAIVDWKAVALADAVENHAHTIVVRMWHVFGVRVEHVDTLGQMREALLDERDEPARGGWLQKQRTPPHARRARATRLANHALNGR